MGRFLLNGVAGAILVLLVGGSAFAGDRPQLSRSAGLTADEAAGMSLDAIYVHFINRSGGSDDKQSARIGGGSRNPAALRQLAASARLGAEEAARMSIDELYVRNINRSGGSDDRQSVAIARSSSSPALRRQLAASAGLRAEEAARMSLGEIAVHKHNRSSNGDDRIELVK